MNRTQPMHLSFSSLNQSAQCRRGWFSKYILGRKTPAGEAANFGKRFEEALTVELGATVAPAQHKSIREEAKTLPDVPPSAEKIVEIEAARDAAEERLQEDIARGISVYRERPDTLPPMPGSKWVESSAPSVMKNGAQERTLTAQKEVWMEPGQWEVLADFYGVRSAIHLPFLGYIDFLEQTGPMGMQRRVVDLKTSTRKGFQLSWAVQTTLYALFERAQICEAHLVVRPTPKLDEDGHPVPSKKPPQFRAFVYPFRPTPATFAWVMQWAGVYADQIRKDTEADCLESLLATPNYGCQWCPESGMCEPYLLSKLTAAGETDE